MHASSSRGTRGDLGRERHGVQIEAPTHQDRERQRSFSVTSSDRPVSVDATLEADEPAIHLHEREDATAVAELTISDATTGHDRKLDTERARTQGRFRRGRLGIAKTKVRRSRRGPFRIWPRRRLGSGRHDHAGSGTSSNPSTVGRTSSGRATLREADRPSRNVTDTLITPWSNAASSTCAHASMSERAASSA